MHRDRLQAVPVRQDPQTEQLIWDLPTRIFHWCLAAFLVCAYVFAQLPPPSFYWHVVFGVGTGLLLIWRFIWGFVGSRHARFSALFFSFGEIKDYFGAVLSGKGHYYGGHNPGSAVAIWLMFLLTVVTVVTGVAAGSEVYEDLHKMAANVLIFVILLHIAGVLLATAIHRENYFWSMITGRKRAAIAESITDARPLAALIMVAFVFGGMVYFIAGLDFNSGVFRAPGTNFFMNVGERESEENNEHRE